MEHNSSFKMHLNCSTLLVTSIQTVFKIKHCTGKLKIPENPYLVYMKET